MDEGVKGSEIVIKKSDIDPLSKADLFDDLPTVELRPNVAFRIERDLKVKEPEGIKVRLGLPIDKEGLIIPPSEPTVATIDKLVCQDETIRPKWALLKDVTCLFCHGRWDEKKETWVLANGQRVKDVVNAWNEYAEQNGMQQIDFILTCNTQSIVADRGMTIGESLRSLFSVDYKKRLQEKRLRNKIVNPSLNLQRPTVESLGKVISMSGRYANNESFIKTWVENGTLVGLEDLLLAKSL